MSYSDSSYAVFQGQLFAAPRLLNGALTGGYVFVGDVDEFVIDPKQKFEDIMESQTGMGLQAAHIPVETSLGVKMRALDNKMDNWVKATWGTYHGTVATGIVTGEALTVFDDEGIIPLAHPGVSSLVVKQGVTSLTVDTDYTADLTNGSIKRKSGGAITFTGGKATDITADYSYAAYTGVVDAFTSGQQIFSLRLHGKNTGNSNQPVIVDVFQWAPDMAKTLSMIAKKRMVFDLDGALLQDTTRALATAANPYSQFFKVTKA